jgi:beta-glucosidase/6-phospho-beta-glucosidase/beta-galactosidase
MLDVMEELGLEPNATLHHFTHPTWFEDLGAFSREANIQLFVDWSCFMFRTFSSRIKLWCTFNEPTASKHEQATSFHPAHLHTPCRSSMSP